MATEINSCPFCSIAPERIHMRNEKAFAIYDAFPVSPGHTLIIPFAHEQDYFALDRETQQACWDLLNAVAEQHSREWKPDGFNIGINAGRAAGQTVMHVHLHLIPRYAGDEDDPRGGVRGVLPGKKKY